MAGQKRLAWWFVYVGDVAERFWGGGARVVGERVAEGGMVPPVYMAAADAALGDGDAALASLGDAVRARDRRLMSLRTDPVWDVLRSDPRFTSLLRGIINARPGLRPLPQHWRAP